MNTDLLKEYLNKFAEKIGNENVELYKRIIDGIEIKEFKNPEDFYYAVLYTWENFISGFLHDKLGDNEDVVFIHKKYGYIERHFCSLIENIEGSVCSADKSKMIIKRLVKFYALGEKIEFDYNAEYTYHLSTKIFKTHERIIAFYEALRELYYGKPLKYITILTEIIEQVD